MKNTILALTIVSSLLIFSGKNIATHSFGRKTVNAKNLKQYFPKRFKTEQKPRLLEPRELTKKEHIQVKEYVLSLVEVVET